MTEVYQKIIGGPSPQNLEYKVSMQSLGSSKINVHKASKAVKIELWEKWSGAGGGKITCMRRTVGTVETQNKKQKLE